MCLVALGLVTGSLGAWADNTITATLVHTAGTAYGAAAGKANTVDSESEYYNWDRTNTSYWDGWAFAEFNFEIPEGEKIKSASLKWKIKQGGKGKYSSSLYSLNQGTTVDYDAIAANTKQAYQFGSARTFIETTTNNPAGDVEHTTDVTAAVKNLISQKSIIFQVTGNDGSATLYGKASDYAPALTITTVDASSMSSYTVKYVDGDGNEIKTSVKYEGINGEKAEIKDEDKVAIYNADKTKKYIYVSDDAASTTIAEDGTSVVTVTFREAVKWTYSVNAVGANNVVLQGNIVEGSNFEGETFNVPYPYALNIDGTLYTSSKLSSDGKGYYFSQTLTADKQTKNITFKASAITGLVYFSEAENVEGLTPAVNGNTFIRSSNGASAYAADKNVELVTLPAGKYKLSACICDVNPKPSLQWNFLAGENNILSYVATSVNWSLGVSDEFTLSKETPIYLAKGGSNTSAVDFIYIQKTGEYVPDYEVSVGETGFATYVMEANVTIPSDVNAYAVTLSDETVALKEIAAGAVVEKGTGILLKAQEGQYKFTVSDEDVTTISDNDLVAATADVTADGTQYALAQKNGKVGFAKVKAGVVIPAGKAYLKVSASEAKTAFFALDGETTAISNVATEAEANNGAFYTLQGVKVAKLAKGLYIHNGKKVLVK